MTNLFEKISYKVNRWILDNPHRIQAARVFWELLFIPLEPKKLKNKVKKFYFRIKHTMHWKFNLNKTYWDIRKIVWRNFLTLKKLPSFIHIKVYWGTRKRLYKLYEQLFKK